LFVHREMDVTSAPLTIVADPPRSTTLWTEAAVVGAASIMLMRERQKPERVAAFLERMASQLPLT